MVMEAIYIHTNKPNNRDRGRFNLYPIWNNILKKRELGSLGPLIDEPVLQHPPIILRVLLTRAKRFCNFSYEKS